jgi:hypothetical protein
MILMRDERADALVRWSLSTVYRMVELASPLGKKGLKKIMAEASKINLKLECRGTLLGKRRLCLASDSCAVRRSGRWRNLLLLFLSSRLSDMSVEAVYQSPFDVRRSQKFVSGGMTHLQREQLLIGL